MGIIGEMRGAPIATYGDWGLPLPRQDQGAVVTAFVTTFDTPCVAAHTAATAPELWDADRKACDFLIDSNILGREQAQEWLKTCLGQQKEQNAA